jgi:hypothetical protein
MKHSVLVMWLVLLGGMSFGSDEGRKNKLGFRDLR